MKGILKLEKFAFHNISCLRTRQIRKKAGCNEMNNFPIKTFKKKLKLNVCVPKGAEYKISMFIKLFISQVLENAESHHNC